MKKVRCAREVQEGQGVGGELWQSPLDACADTLLDTYAEQVQMIYIDPPFFTGQQFQMNMRIGDVGWKRSTPALALEAYDDAWPDEQTYLAMMRRMLSVAHGLLRPDGTIFVHLDMRMHAALKQLLDEIFGAKNCVNEIIWAYQSGGRSLKHFSRKHDTILFYRKQAGYFFDITTVPVSRAENRNNHMRRAVDAEGRSYRTITANGKTYTYYDDEPVYPSDVWTDISHLQQKDPERTGYDTQKPLKLLERILLCSTRPGDLVADLCFGSGTTLVAAAKQDRRFLGVDQGRMAHAVARKRLLECKATRHVPVGQGNQTMHVQTDRMDGIGFIEVTLTGCELDWKTCGIAPLDVAGLDAVDQWSLGFLRGDDFVPMAHAARSRAHPQLQRTLEVPMVSGALCVSVLDVLGNQAFFAWEDTHG